VWTRRLAFATLRDPLLLRGGAGIFSVGALMTAAPVLLRQAD
jgi:hypothetical protein